MALDPVIQLKKNARFIDGLPPDLEELERLLSGDLILEHRKEPPAGRPNVLVRIGGERRPYHRPKDPYGEWAEHLAPDQELDVLVLLGTGFGYQFLKALPAARRARRIVVAEPLFEPLVTLLTQVDLEGFFDERMALCYAPSPESLAEYLMRFFRRYQNTGFKMVPLAFVVRHLPKYCDRVRELAEQTHRRHLIFLHSLREQSEDITRNVLDNMRRLSRRKLLRMGSARGQHALVVASGPSFDLNRPLLRRLADHVHVIAVGSALPLLLEAGVKPDLVVVSDPQALNLWHFPEPHYDIPLAFDMTVPAAIVDKFAPGSMACNAQQDLVKLIHQNVHFTPVQSWGTVASTALEVCGMAGFGEIALIGVDFSFRSGGTHAAGYQVGHKHAREIEMTDITGKRVLTWRNYAEYARYMRDQVLELRSAGRRVINCSEGGILEGAESMTLRHYFNSLEAGGVRKAPWDWAVDITKLPPAVAALRKTLGWQTRDAHRYLQRVGRGDISMNVLFSNPVAAAGEGFVFREAIEMEEALFGGSKYEVERLRLAIGEKMDEFVRRLDAVLEEIEKSSG